MAVRALPSSENGTGEAEPSIFIELEGTVHAASAPVREINAHNKEHAAKLLAAELDDFSRTGLAHSQITILSPKEFHDSSAWSLPDRLRLTIRALDQHGIRSFPADATSFAKIADFKGLENDAVIVVDLPAAPFGDFAALCYVGMCWARAVLSVIFSATT